MMDELAQLAAPAGGSGGEPPDIEQIFIQNAAFVRSVAIKKFGVPEVVVDDIVHEVFTRYLRVDKRADGDNVIPVYLLSLTSCVCNEYARRNSTASRITHPPLSSLRERISQFRSRLINVSVKFGELLRRRP
jgi:hypothetical protein